MGGATDALPQAPPPDASAAAVVKQVGTIKSIAGNSVLLTTDAGTAVTVQIQDSTRMVRTVPGQKDLKSAAPVQLQDLHVGDRLLVREKASADGNAMVAVSVVVMAASDIAARQEQERQDWQKRGISGLVTAIDVGNGTITTSTSGFGGNKTIVIHTSKETIVRRYAPDSVKFDDARPATLEQVKAGDQLRARGVRSADGSELTAEEIVCGTFRNIAGTVLSIDASNNSVSVMDLATKKPVSLKITGDSQLRSLPAMVAQRIAARLKGGSSPSGQSSPPRETPSAAAAGDSGPTGGGPRPGGAPDFQQMLGRMPAVALADLQKGTAVMIVATQGTASSPPTAVTLLTGVEAILMASPDGSRAAMLLSPWNLGGAGDAGGTNP